MTHKKLSLLLVLALFLFSSCNDTTDNKKNEKQKPEITTNPSIVKFNGKVFSVPSPFQVSFLVKDTQVPYNGDLLNAVDKLPNYLSEFKKATNLGIYGANLGYLTVYDQLPQASKYFAAIKRLTQELHMESVMDADLMQRVEKNMDNKDSLLYLASSTFRNSDSYLMQNQRTEVAVMIVTGAWVETLFLLTQLAPESGDPQVFNRIGEQKYTLDNILELLRPFYGGNAKEFDRLTERLVDLATVFDGVTIDYVYNEPIVDLNKKTTTVTSTTKTNISDYQLKTISEMIAEIRGQIIN